jgi:DNA-binding transcriptional LysR family regulator
MLDTVRLMVFLQVASMKSIARAARTLGYTPSAVSQQVSKLEREVGATLISRTRQGVELTPAGRTLADRATGILQHLAAAEQSVRDVVQARERELRLGSFASGSLTLVAPAIARFRQQHPSVRLLLVEVEPPHGYDSVRSGRLDLLISHAYPNVITPEPTALIREELLSDPLVAVFPPERGARTVGTTVRAEDLAGMPLICGGPTDANRVALDALFVSSGITPQVDFETIDYAVTLALVSAGAGAAVVPATVARQLAPHLVAFPVIPTQSRRVFAVARQVQGESTLSRFMDLLRQTALEASHET